EGGMALEVRGEKRQALLELARLAIGFEQALRDEREVSGVLRFDALPMLDRALDAAVGLLQVAELQARAHALAVHLERLLEVAPRRVRARVRRVADRALAEEMRELLGARLARFLFQAPRHLARLVPVLLLLEDLEQEAPCVRCVRSLGEALEDLLGAIEDARLEVVLAERVERRRALLGAEVGALQQVLVHADRAVVFAAPTEEAAEREVQLDRLRIDLDHLDERLD